MANIKRNITAFAAAAAMLATAAAPTVSSFAAAVKSDPATSYSDSIIDLNQGIKRTILVPKGTAFYSSHSKLSKIIYKAPKDMLVTADKSIIIGKEIWTHTSKGWICKRTDLVYLF